MLPQEIVDNIACYCSQQTLVDLALVSRACARTAQRLLFHAIQYSPVSRFLNVERSDRYTRIKYPESLIESLYVHKYSLRGKIKLARVLWPTWTYGMDKEANRQYYRRIIVQLLVLLGTLSGVEELQYMDQQMRAFFGAEYVADTSTAHASTHVYLSLRKPVMESCMDSMEPFRAPPRYLVARLPDRLQVDYVRGRDGWIKIGVETE